MTNKTISTYAILDILSARGQDIIDTYIPLVSSLIIKLDITVIDRNTLCDSFRKEYGIESITYGAMDSILTRMRKNGMIELNNHKLYSNKQEILKNTHKLPSIDLSLDLQSLIEDIDKFGKRNYNLQISRSEIEKGILTFLDRTEDDLFLGHEALNNVVQNKGKKNSLRYIISNFILKNQYNPQKISLIVRLAKGHLLAKIISLDYLDSYQGNMKNVTVALDAPIVFNLLGLNEDSAFQLTEELMNLLKSQGAKFVVFSANYNEVVSTLNDAVYRLTTHSFDLYKSSRVLKFAVPLLSGIFIQKVALAMHIHPLSALPRAVLAV